MTFNEAYKSLNSRQKEAVDTTQGPVMVVAGPGTGKTQLLATRVANILLSDSTLLPSNILCLTFSEAGQVAMQRRLIELMGGAGAHVAVHTFHSFGTEIINSFPQYFYQGANYSPADELTTHEIISDILKTLPHRNPLASQNQGDYVFLKSIKSRIQELKKSAVTPEELNALALDGLKFVDFIEPALNELFDVPSFSKASDIDRADVVLALCKTYSNPPLNINTFLPLSKVFYETFRGAIDSAKDANKTVFINNWKKDWFNRDENKQPVCKQRVVLEKLQALAKVYASYQAELNKRRLFDFDDMIVKVVHALESRGDLAYELQEQYLYFLVDEFQDTNAGQLRLLHALANHPVNEGRPNLLVVGDDDQAIYSFQGAKLSNILSFKDSYRDVKLITLTNNYRSTPEILNTARGVILQGEDRLETHLPNEINKTLTAKAVIDGQKQIVSQTFTSQTHEFEWIAQETAKLIKSGEKASEIAVICREHKYLEAILPYLYEHNVKVSYEKRQNALDNSKVQELITLARVVDALSLQDEVYAESLLPECLSADYWQIPASNIWKLSLNAKRQSEKSHSKTYWLELMLKVDSGHKLNEAGKFLIEAAKFCRVHSLEQTLDLLIGSTESATSNDTSEDHENEKAEPKVASPFKQFYFKDNLINDKPQEYLELLSCLTAIRNHLRLYKPGIKLTLTDFINFVDLCHEANISIKVAEPHLNYAEAVRLITAHGSKGLEFNTVFVLSAVSKIWDSKNRGSNIPLAPNLLQIAHDHNPDDNLRLFYVTVSRARKNLYVSDYLVGDDGKEVTPFAALQDEEVLKSLPRPSAPTPMPDSLASQLIRAERHWYDKHYELPNSTMRELLSKRLETYQLNATHLNNFLDVTNSGPSNFLLGNLLQFPSAMNPSAAYGSAMHSTLQQAHSYYLSNNKFIDTDALKTFFKQSLAWYRLGDTDEQLFIERGLLALDSFINNQKKLCNKNQLPEQSFYSQNVRVGEARLTGRLDILEINKTAAKVIDYKTGKPLGAWSDSGKSVYDRIKTHNYKQQLYFYKLLVDGSRTWGSRHIKTLTGELVFIEPNNKGDMTHLLLELNNDDELKRLEQLIQAVWKHIQNLDFPDTSDYTPNEAGIKDFEDWLIGH